MSWKFWQRSQSPAETTATPKIKAAGPKELPQRIGQHLVTKENMDPDLAWSLKYLAKPIEASKSKALFRVYNPNSARAAGVRVSDYNSLDAHPELVLYHGRFDKKLNQLEIESTAPATAA